MNDVFQTQRHYSLFANSKAILDLTKYLKEQTRCDDQVDDNQFVKGTVATLFLGEG